MLESVAGARMVVDNMHNNHVARWMICLPSPGFTHEMEMFAYVDESMGVQWVKCCKLCQSYISYMVLLASCYIKDIYPRGLQSLCIIDYKHVPMRLDRHICGQIKSLEMVQLPKGSSTWLANIFGTIGLLLVIFVSSHQTLFVDQLKN